MTSSTHKEVQYENFSFDSKNNTITISGNTSSYVTLAYFLTSLDRLERKNEEIGEIEKILENVQLSSANLTQNKEGKTVVNFTIKFSLSNRALEKKK